MITFTVSLHGCTFAARQKDKNRSPKGIDCRGIAMHPFKHTFTIREEKANPWLYKVIFIISQDPIPSRYEEAGIISQ